MTSVKPFALRHALAASLALGAVATLFGGCTRQSEGERCSISNGDEDCDGSLVCTPASDLQQGGDGVDRCCPPAGDSVGDSRCNPRVGGGSGTGGASGSGGANGMAGDTNQGGASQGTGQRGASCSYTSECESGLVCGPGGVCQPECIDHVDCPAERPVCNSQQKCVATTP